MRLGRTGVSLRKSTKSVLIGGRGVGDTAIDRVGDMTGVGVMLAKGWHWPKSTLLGINTELMPWSTPSLAG